MITPRSRGPSSGTWSTSDGLHLTLELSAIPAEDPVPSPRLTSSQAAPTPGCQQVLAAKPPFLRPAPIWGRPCHVPCPRVPARPCSWHPSSSQTQGGHLLLPMSWFFGSIHDFPERSPLELPLTETLCEERLSLSARIHGALARKVDFFVIVLVFPQKKVH